jgi:hypothetical protein
MTYVYAFLICFVFVCVAWKAWDTPLTQLNPRELKDEL